MPRFKVVAALKRENYPLDLEREMFSKLNCELQSYVVKDEDNTLRCCAEAHIILTPVGGGVFSKDVLDRLDNCIAIIRYGIGLDGIDVARATELGIIIANVPDFCVDEVSTHTLMLILCCWRRLLQLHRSVEKGSWSYHPYRPIYRLKGKTLGLISFGKIARAVATKAKPLGLNILGYNPRMNPEKMKSYGARPVSLHELLRLSDIVSVHAPATKETYHMIGEKELRMMKPDSILINTSRGAIVDEDALYKALSSGWIAGAGIDVLETEPPNPTNPLVTLKNVIFTPHCAFYSEESLYDLHRGVAGAAIDLMRGKFPSHVVNPEVRDKARLFMRGS